MLTNDSLRSADGGRQATTRRRLLHVAATVAAIAPLAALSASGAAKAPPADAVKVPLVAAGGIADARGTAAAFALGASVNI